MGTHTFDLHARSGDFVCPSVRHTMIVTACEPVLVELTWKTPGDAATELELEAEAPFELSEPVRGGSAYAVLGAPQDGTCYDLAIFHRADHDAGPSYATPSVYVYSNRRRELRGVALDEGDRWHVTELCWPSTDLTPHRVCDDGSACSTDADCADAETRAPWITAGASADPAADPR